MPTVYQIQVLNHLVDGYEDAERKVVGAERWHRSCSEDVARAWDEKQLTDAQSFVGPTAEARARDARIQRRIRETTGLRHQAESDLSIARERETQAMRTLCDAVLLAAREGRS